MSDQSRTTEHYLDQLRSLLPEGPFWAGFVEKGGRGNALLAAKAEGLSAIDRRVGDLMTEANPLNVMETLVAREVEAGLPKKCFPSSPILQERVAALIAQWRSQGGQSRQYFIDLAATLGFEVTITEYRPFQAGVSCAGDLLCDETWRFRWQVKAPETTIKYFAAGVSGAGEPLATWGNELLECGFSIRKPAHTEITHTYEG